MADPRPTCTCVWCENDRRDGHTFVILRGPTAEGESSRKRRYFDPRLGFPAWVSRAKAPLVGPMHAAQAKPMIQEIP